LGIGAEAFVGQPHGIPPRQRPKIFRQIVGKWYLCFADQNWNDSFALFQRRGDLNAGEILGIVEPPHARGIPHLKPAFTNDGQDDVTFGDSLA
jgi:hypothetical protein